MARLTSTKIEFAWENPPKSHNLKYEKVMKKLVENPNRWALLGTANRTSGFLKVSLSRAAACQNPNGIVEMTGRSLTDKTMEVYARWIPKEEEQ